MRSKEGFTDTLHYFGTSADEVAILEKVYSSMGYFIVSRTITTEGEELELHTEPDDDTNHIWQILYVYKYTSERGMMTVKALAQQLSLPKTIIHTSCFAPLRF